MTQITLDIVKIEKQDISDKIKIDSGYIISCEDLPEDITVYGRTLDEAFKLACKSAIEFLEKDKKNNKEFIEFFSGKEELSAMERKKCLNPEIITENGLTMQQEQEILEAKNEKNKYETTNIDDFFNELNSE